MVDTVNLVDTSRASWAEPVPSNAPIRNLSLLRSNPNNDDALDRQITCPLTTLPSPSLGNSCLPCDRISREPSIVILLLCPRTVLLEALGRRVVAAAVEAVSELGALHVKTRGEMDGDERVQDQ
jgi:hypothetical protein